MNDVKKLSAFLTAVAVAFCLLAGPTPPTAAQVRHVYDRGAAGVLQQMRKLRTTASVLLIAAHPDDEDSAFIARAARGDDARVAYLSLNRGEGGQNAIGPEQYDALGVIRTEELLQARALDGGGQFFGRMYDFGFSKTITEASRLWGDQEVLRDMVRIIRIFKPLVVYSIFSGTPADGHGHHQLAGRLTPKAFREAADPTKFPEQLAEGLRPWRPLKLYRGAIHGEAPTTLVETGRFDPLLGRSYEQIAAEGRSQHKSQGQGTPEIGGAVASALVLLDSSVKTRPGETSVFDGIDTSLAGIPGLTGLPAGALRAELAGAERAAERAIGGYDLSRPAGSIQALADILTSIRNARAALTKINGASGDAKSNADFILAEKEKEVVLAIREASGTVIDADSGAETVAPGESLNATVKVFLAQPSLVKIHGVSMKAPDGWRIAPAPAAQSSGAQPGAAAAADGLDEKADRQDSFVLSVPQNAVPSQPYWLTTPRRGQLYTWPAGAPAGEPFGPPLVTAFIQAVIDGVQVTFSEPLQFRTVDDVRGELRRNVDVVPPVSVSFDSPLQIVPLASAGQPRRIVVRLQSNAQDPVSGDVALKVPPGWTSAPARLAFSLHRKGERAAFPFDVSPPATAPAGRYTLKAAVDIGGRTFDFAMQVISYPHIRTHRLYVPAEAQVQLIDLKVAPVKVGYIMGSGDTVPDALRRMGLDVTMLDEDALASGDLSRFDTIVVGIRASEVRPDFIAANERLLDYVRAGGTLIVQYQRDLYAAMGLPPFPARISSRVTDEDSPMTILAPDHPAFTAPNRIAPQDFDGWVQDRDLYAFSTFDPRYVPLLRTHDPGEPDQDGGEVYAKLGKGNFVYTSYAWFRQLPAGVPGAYRIFANLVSLGADHR